ncbi:MAG: N-acetylmuramoyl-L-alanine amidase [Deltaproteobacteria bacterium]
MKKLSGFFICLFIILSISSIQVFAAIKLVYDGKVHIYNERPVSLIVNNKILKPKVPPVVLNQTTLVPARAVFEEMGAKVFWKQSTKQVTIKSTKNTIVLVVNSDAAVVNGKKEKLTIPAKVINENTMIPLRFVSEKLGMEVKWNADSYSINISDKKTGDDSSKESDTNTTKPDQNGASGQIEKSNTGVINNINFQSRSEETLIRIESDVEFSDFSKLELNEEGKSFRLVIDIPDRSIVIPQLTIPIEDGRIIKIRSAQYQESPKKVRIVLDMNTKRSYNINYSDDKKALMVSVGGTVSQNNNTNPSQNQDTIKDSGNSKGTIDDYEYLNSRLGEENSIAVKDEEEKICVTINKRSEQKFKAQRVTAPNSIEVDINNAAFKEQSFMIPVSSAPITSIGAEQANSAGGKIIIQTAAQVPFQAIEEPTSFKIYIYKEGYKNISYENSGAISTLIISNADTTKQIIVEQDADKSQAKILLPEGLVNTEQQSMYINDGMVEGLEIGEEKDSGREIDIKFSNKSKISYSIRTDTRKNIYVYFFARDKVKVPDGDILIAIDAGHGGSDPGTVYKDKNGVVKVKEKDLNLDIACKLNKILTDLGIPTIMTRTKDERIELHQRTVLANSMKADLFVSIHNNWIDSPTVAGTMTLYFPYDNDDNGLTSKRFAQIMQEELLRTVDTKDRKIVSRPDLAVLNSSDMPAVLVECGFVSNESDRNKLTTAEHREKIAEAIYTAIIKALGELEK